MRNALLVFLGGGLGSVARYLTVLGIARLLPQGTFPWGVFTANVLGSFILGFLCVWPMMRTQNTAVWLLLTTGFLGGYTTFSTFTANTWELFESGQSVTAFMNAIGSLLAGLLAAALGFTLARWWHG
jgi:CrcB protein